jgi:hypothetical protein
MMIDAKPDSVRSPAQEDEDVQSQNVGEAGLGGKVESGAWSVERGWAVPQTQCPEAGG